jgi:hypothetical protein
MNKQAMLDEILDAFNNVEYSKTSLEELGITDSYGMSGAENFSALMRFAKKIKSGFALDRSAR